MKFFLAGCAFWGAGAAALFAVRPGSRLNGPTIQTAGRPQRAAILVLVLLLILLCVLPMGLSPIWNGQEPDHRNQYEVMAESILDGHLYLDYGAVDPKLLAMEDPYDAALRKELGVWYPWDHAFYKGHYYMYFGVVPVFLVFLPYRVLTGLPLTTYHATQLFTAAFIVGVFALFYLLAKKFFPALPCTSWAALAAAVCLMSVWYAVAAPALYCTAITAALCVEVWSLYCFARAVWGSASVRQAVGFGMLGSFLGALAFGCRPTIALANLLAVPLLLVYVKGKKPDRSLLGQIALVALPYFVVAALLMLYNYARFENPFEFGQRYQLTVADQTALGFSLTRQELARLARGLWENLFDPPEFSSDFPYLAVSSVLANFPLCAAGILLLFKKSTFAALRKNGLAGFAGVLLGLPFLIVAFQVVMSPFQQERYHMDVYWLLGLLAFLSLGMLCQTAQKGKRLLGFLLPAAACLTALRAFLYWLTPYDLNFTEYYPEYFQRIAKVLSFGLLY